MAWFRHRQAQIEAESRKNFGKIRRQDLWRKNYYGNPYLARATDDGFFQRVCDVFHNQVELDDQGRISPKPGMYNDAWMLQRWAHVMEEAGVRGGFSGEMMTAANEPLNKYFENGEPPGVSLFRDAPPADRNPLVKYSKSEFIERMYRFGEIRIAPASIYADGSLLNAQQDLEIQREFTIPTASLAIKGFKTAEIEGAEFDISKGDVSIVEEVPNYYVYCMCREIDRRLPTDFDADAALVIHDIKQFQRRFFDAIRERYGGWDMKNGEVTYFDPYTDYKRHRNLEMIKHFRFHYQKEFRLVVRPRKLPQGDLEPFFISLGSLEEISTPYYSAN